MTNQSTSMSLRTRWLGSITLVLLAKLELGGVSGLTTAMGFVDIATQAVLDVGHQAARNGSENIAASRNVSGELDWLVRTSDRDGHLGAVLRDAAGQNWAALVLPQLPAAVLRWIVPVGIGIDPGILLVAEPANRVSEVWTQLRDSLTMLIVLCGSGAALVSLTAGPIQWLREQVSPASAECLNAMVVHVGLIEHRKCCPHERFVVLQQKKPAHLAHSLPDEVDFHLFTTALDSTSVKLSTMAGRYGARSVQVSACSNHRKVLLNNYIVEPIRLLGSVVLDFNFLTLGGLDLLHGIPGEQPTARVIALSMHADEHHASSAVQAGTKGYFSKNALFEELFDSVRRALAGGRRRNGMSERTRPRDIAAARQWQGPGRDRGCARAELQGGGQHLMPDRGYPPGDRDSRLGAAVERAGDQVSVRRAVSSGGWVWTRQAGALVRDGGG
jgi:ActR/RegA family two-component response regulator